ncbi:hypothetical protein A9Q84_15060 [Halobacteriovorax marinus]|uniref:Uncharacterized protein n=1 Tax=Halobacteriovorax marinus TaxID=97084 RepID=A0A1Y5F5H7_9BACT|nr:hypothetical protein A9Q84_15060 [Halobacteriovorax marinus]
MICLNLKQELQNIHFELSGKLNLEGLRKIYSKSIQEGSELSQVLLSMFYRMENENYPDESISSELTAIISSLPTDYKKSYRCEINLILASEYKRLGHEELFQKTLQIANEIEATDLAGSQVTYLAENLAKVVTGPKLKGKELVLYNSLLAGPKEKFDLIFEIYGNDCDISKCERSFKTLLNRLRKKMSEEIILNTENFYEIRS